MAVAGQTPFITETLISIRGKLAFATTCCWHFFAITGKTGAIICVTRTVTNFQPFSHIFTKTLHAIHVTATTARVWIKIAAWLISTPRLRTLGSTGARFGIKCLRWVLRRTIRLRDWTNTLLASWRIFYKGAIAYTRTSGIIWID